mmetsp:Transcript_57346/g.102500  ORF Transcript_57346/g.102500 Transcript_57346/m.102500 type:complete len:204 (-) Transcript_57346:1297-1908(-)
MGTYPSPGQRPQRSSLMTFALCLGAGGRTTACTRLPTSCPSPPTSGARSCAPPAYPAPALATPPRSWFGSPQRFCRTDTARGPTHLPMGGTRSLSRCSSLGADSRPRLEPRGWSHMPWQQASPSRQTVAAVFPLTFLRVHPRRCGTTATGAPAARRTHTTSPPFLGSTSRECSAAWRRPTAGTTPRGHPMVWRGVMPRKTPPT